ncbi:hypothetical protein QUF72_09010 [Desulfobacterales bacterium HSG2]|nr:hypothetical protein [Desulfobacterales bacterium HSG2]
MDSRFRGNDSVRWIPDSAGMTGRCARKHGAFIDWMMTCDRQTRCAMR